MAKNFKNTNSASQNNLLKKTYYISGMHCPSCELVIEKELSEMEGVAKADASLSKNCVEITAEPQSLPDTSKLNKQFAELGYTFHQNKLEETKLNKTDVKKIVGIFVLFVIAFYFLEKTSFFARFTVNPASSPFSYFIFGIAAGLSSCAALVGGILLSLSDEWNKLYNGNTKKSAQPFILFNVSRILAFAIFGGILGIIGSAFKISITFSSVLTILVSILMLALAFQMLNIGWFKNLKIKMPKIISKSAVDTATLKGKYVPLIAGAMTFFIPCGFTLIAQTNALATGSILKGSVALTSFALGTLPVLGLISFTSIKFHSNKNFSGKFNLFAGLLISFFALYTINSQLNVLGMPSLNDIKFSKQPQPVQEQPASQTKLELQIIRIEASGFNYYPREITIKSGIKTRLEINNRGATGCATALYARGLYPSVIHLKPGLNTAEFTPGRKGTYKISCSMGMVPPITVRVL